MKLELINSAQIIEGLAGVFGLWLFRLVLHYMDKKNLLSNVTEIALAWGVTWILRKVSVNVWQLYEKQRHREIYAYSLNL